MIKQLLSTLWGIVGAVCIASAQPRFSSDIEMYGFGQIAWKQPVTARFVVTNTGNRPLLLTNAEPDCDCTVAKWTETPIVPGGTGTVEVTFDARALGHFDKAVAIRSNAASSPVYLRLSGEVVREIKDFSRTHPYLIGQIRIDKNSIDFPDIHGGERAEIRMGVANLTGDTYEPVLMHLPSYLQAKAEPPTLKPGEKGTITLTLEAERLTDLGLTQTNVYLSRFSGDKVGEENEIPVSVVLLPDFSKITAEERAHAPAITLSATEIDMTELLAKKSKAHQDIFVTNSGRSPLQISKLQVFHPAVGVSLKKNVLQPGETTRLRVTVTKKNITGRHRPLRLLMITNDPLQPKVEINIFKY